MGDRFQKGPSYRTPFGQNEWLGSTDELVHESWTSAASGVPAETIDGYSQKVLQPGTILAEITSGDDVGKVGAFDTAASDGRQTKANIRGVCGTFVPWALNEHDVEVDVVIQAWGDKDHIYGYDTTKKSLTTLVSDSVLALTDFQSPLLNIRFRKRYIDDTGANYGSWPL